MELTTETQRHREGREEYGSKIRMRIKIRKRIRRKITSTIRIIAKSYS
jgi:hypothetical protein